MKYWKSALIFLAAFLMQTNILNFIAIKSYTPNTLLISVIIFSYFFRNEYHGLMYGTIFGALYDMSFSQVIGPTALSLALVAILIYFFSISMNDESYLNISIISIISIVIFYISRWGLLRLAGNPRGVVTAFYEVAFSCIYTFIVVIIIFTVILRKRHKNIKSRYYR